VVGIPRRISRGAANDSFAPKRGSSPNTRSQTESTSQSVEAALRQLKRENR